MTRWGFASFVVGVAVVSAVAVALPDIVRYMRIKAM
jgi:hypothetical protein